MATGAWIDGVRKSMQRLGFLKCICSAASPDRGTTLADLARRHLEAASRKHDVDLGENARVGEYILENKLNASRYRGLDSSRIGVGGPYRMPVEAQDCHLADLRLPSSTGAITPDVADEPVRLAIQLGLLRDVNMTLTGRGQLVAGLQPNAILDLQNLGPNPLALTAGETLVWSAYVWEADRDVAAALCAGMVREKEFTRASLGDQLPELLRPVTERYSGMAVTAEDKARLRRLNEVVESVRQSRGKPAGGTGRAREQFITMRLESAVDLGYLNKVGRAGYQYEVNDRTALVCEALSRADPSGWDPINAFVESHPSGSFEEVRDEQSVFELISTASERLASPLGFRPISDSTLLASVGLMEVRRFISHRVAVEVLERMQRARPKALQFMRDRDGRVALFKPAGLNH